MEYFFDTILSDTVKVHPACLHKKLHSQILKLLRTKYEGVCSRFGYINENSVEIIEVGKGMVEIHTFHGYVLYNVKFRAAICNPAIGSLMVADVVSMNSFGILCASAYTHAGPKRTNIVDIIVPRQVNDMMSDPVHLNNVKVGDKLNIEIIGKKYQLNHTRISTIGKVVERQLESSGTTRKDSLDTLNSNMNTVDSDNESDDDAALLIVNDDNSSEDNMSEKSFGMDDLKDLEDDIVDDTGESIRNEEASDNEDY